MKIILKINDQIFGTFSCFSKANASVITADTVDASSFTETQNPKGSSVKG